MKEANLFDTGAQTAELAPQILAQSLVGAFLYLTELTVRSVLPPGYEHCADFEFGPDLILHGPEAALGGSSLVEP